MHGNSHFTLQKYPCGHDALVTIGTLTSAHKVYDVAVWQMNPGAAHKVGGSVGAVVGVAVVVAVQE
jgi:hypothetical protein